MDAGVWFMVNEGDGRGRSAHNVTRVRALFADFDGANPDPAVDALAPHIAVESSPGKYHIYWKVSDCPLEMFKPLKKAIIAKYGGDPSCSDLPRVLRVPGFYHVKKEPVKTELLYTNDMPEYTVAQIIEGLGLGNVSAGTVIGEKTKVIDEKDLDQELDVKRAWTYIREEAPVTICDSGTGDQTVFRVACRVIDFGLSQEKALELMIDYNAAKIIPSIELEVLEKKVSNAWNHRSGAVGKDSVAAMFPDDGMDNPEWLNAVPEVPAGEAELTMDGALVEMNQRYAFIIVGDSARILREGFDDVRKRHIIGFLKIDAFVKLFANRCYEVVGADNSIRRVSVATMWMKWVDRRTYHAIIFDPSEKAPVSTYNLYRGLAMKPVQGDWGLMKDHILNIVCDGQQHLFDYFLTWCARIFQDPGGKRPGVAVVLSGVKGAGKSIVIDAMGKLLGEAYISLSSPNEIFGRFNMHLSKAVLVGLEEAFWAGDKASEGKLKAMITDPWLMFEPKNIDSIQMPSHLNFIMSSNEQHIVPVSAGERRHFVLKVRPDRAKDIPYFRAMCKQMEAGGYEAMLYDLMHWDLSKVSLRAAPITEGLTEQLGHSLKPVMQFWWAVLERGYLETDIETGGPLRCKGQNLWPAEIDKSRFHTEFINKFMRGKTCYIKSNHFWTETYTFWAEKDVSTYQPKVNGESQPRMVRMWPLEKLREAFTKQTGLKFTDDELVDVPPDEDPFS